MIRALAYVTGDLVESMAALNVWLAQPYGFHVGQLLTEEVIEYREEFIEVLTAETAPIIRVGTCLGCGRELHAFKAIDPMVDVFAAPWRDDHGWRWCPERRFANGSIGEHVPG